MMERCLAWAWVLMLAVQLVASGALHEMPDDV